MSSNDSSPLSLPPDSPTGTSPTTPCPRRGKERVAIDLSTPTHKQMRPSPDDLASPTTLGSGRSERACQRSQENDHNQLVDPIFTKLPEELRLMVYDQVFASYKTEVQGVVCFPWHTFPELSGASKAYMASVRTAYVRDIVYHIEYDLAKWTSIDSSAGMPNHARGMTFLSTRVEHDQVLAIVISLQNIDKPTLYSLTNLFHPMVIEHDLRSHKLVTMAELKEIQQQADVRRRVRQPNTSTVSKRRSELYIAFAPPTTEQIKVLQEEMPLLTADDFQSGFRQLMMRARQSDSDRLKDRAESLLRGVCRDAWLTPAGSHTYADYVAQIWDVTRLGAGMVGGSRSPLSKRQRQELFDVLVKVQRNGVVGLYGWEPQSK